MVRAVGCDEAHDHRDDDDAGNNNDESHHVQDTQLLSPGRWRPTGKLGGDAVRLIPSCTRGANLSRPSPTVKAATVTVAHRGAVRRDACKTWRMDLIVSPTLSIPAAELGWRFSRSSGPGGQHVNTSDSRVELLWNIAESTALSDGQQEILLARLERRLVGGTLTVSSQEQRSQLRNREIAQLKLAEIVAAALAPPPASRRSTKPSRGSKRRHQAAKQQRSATKQLRRRPPPD